MCHLPVEGIVALRMRLVVALLAVSAGPVLLAAAFVSKLLLAAMAAVSVLLAAAAAWWLARFHRRRLTDLARAAEQTAAGDLTARVPVRAGDEAEPLVSTLNRMTRRTQSYVRALAASREQLRTQLSVLGDTLSSTHDLDRILEVVLRAARSATGAAAGAVLLLNQETATLTGHASGPVEPAGPVERAGEPTAGGSGADRTTPVAVPLGSGLLGTVAATGEARRGTMPADGPTLHPGEPTCHTYLAVPITAAGGPVAHATPWPVPPAVRGVLAVYDRPGDDEFDDADLATLRTFAARAAVAVDNVRIHQEAQRLSLTDPLTGLWNYRYLKESMRREVERASRYSHPLAVLALDLDRFKEVNDAYGHAAGDDVLVEFAHRISRTTREVDLAFRQGGEEFVMLLPETEARGAMVLAQRLGAEVREEPVRISSRSGGSGRLTIGITVSVGIAVYPEHGLTPQAVLDAADDALYAAKAAGRDTCRVANAAPVPAATSELPLRAGVVTPEGDLPRAGVGGNRPPRQTRGG